MDSVLKQQNLRALSVLPLEHQLRASVALELRAKLQAYQMSASIDRCHSAVVEAEAEIEVLELALEQLGVVLS